MSTAVDQIWFSTKQAGEYAGRNAETVQKACGSKELHGHQRSKNASWRIRRECLDAWIEGVPCTHQAAEQVAS